MRGIKTLVYFDIEATGLKSSGRPRITEISFVAVKMEDTLKLSLEIKQLLKNGHSEGNLLQLESLEPRIVNKLTLCIYPMATIVPHVQNSCSSTYKKGECLCMFVYPDQNKGL